MQAIIDTQKESCDHFFYAFPSALYVLDWEKHSPPQVTWLHSRHSEASLHLQPFAIFCSHTTAFYNNKKKIPNLYATHLIVLSDSRQLTTFIFRFWQTIGLLLTVALILQLWCLLNNYCCKANCPKIVLKINLVIWSH